MHSTLTPISGGYQLSSAGPPGAMAEKGPYTYTFGAMNPTTGRAPLLSIADDHGNRQDLSWGGGLTVSDLTSGRQLLFTAGAGGYFTQVDAPGNPGTRTLLTYDASGHATGLTVYLAGSQTPVRSDSFSYGGPNGDAITSSSQGGAVASFTYVSGLAPDPFGNPIPRLSSATYGSGGDASSSDDGGSVQGTWACAYGAIALGYNHWGGDVRQNTLTDPRGNTTRLVFSMSSSLLDNTLQGAIKTIQVTGPESDVWKVSYSPDITNPTQVSLTDPLSHLWQATLDLAGNVTQTTDPLGHLWQFGYTADGLNLASITDPTGPLWQFGYTGTLLTSVTDPAGQTRVTVGYNGFGQPTSVTVPAAVAASGLNETAQFAYDPATGDLVSATDPLGNVLTVNAYDALGDPLSVSVFPDTGNPQTSQTPLPSPPPASGTPPSR
jgi:YD repeat-containing protein